MGEPLSERPPGLGWWLAVTDHVLGDRGLGDADSEQLEFPVHTRRAPQRILARELTDEIADLPGNSGSSGHPATVRFPRPSEPSMAPRGNHRKLLTKGQDLQMEEGAATEQASRGREQRSEERLHLEDATVREEKEPMRSISTTFLVATGPIWRARHRKPSRTRRVFSNSGVEIPRRESMTVVSRFRLAHCPNVPKPIAM